MCRGDLPTRWALSARKNESKQKNMEGPSSHWLGGPFVTVSVVVEGGRKEAHLLSYSDRKDAEEA